MNFELVLRKLIPDFEKNDIRYALIGGFALGVWGIPRATMDLDFLIHKDDLNKLDKILIKKGYKLFFRSENASQYKSDNKELGSLDFLHAFREITLKMLSQAEKKKILKRKLNIKVARPEHIIGLKIQAMANDSQRKLKELADIEAILRLYERKINWKSIKKYFQLFNMEEEFKFLIQIVKNA
jgi:hypothetical protein